MTSDNKSPASFSAVPVRVLIVGAGAAGQSLIQALDPDRYFVAGLVDDDPAKLFLDVLGRRVLGPVGEIPHLVRDHGVAEILISTPSATGSQFLHILNACVKSLVPFRSVPSLGSLISGTSEIAELRQVTLDDLVSLRPLGTGRLEGLTSLAGRAVMVTGAGGSIGSELCRLILNCGPRSLICVDRAETPLFFLQQELSALQHKGVVYSLTDVADRSEMRYLLERYQVDAIFHAAAYKHVPMSETAPHEATRNNVLALVALLTLAEEGGCQDFVLLSSDKAVKPSSIMGCTKRIGELLLASRHRTSMRCLSVRFGNVLGSQGSVIPIFKQQILSSGCIFITHPQMTRYFITIPEAAALILQAFDLGKHGDILVLEMGKPLKIVDLANIVVCLLGKSGDPPRIVYSGVRTGEKLHEELFYVTELPTPISVSGIYRVETVAISEPVLSSSIAALQESVGTRDGDLIRKSLRQIIPEYGGDPFSNPASE